jgi:hypothetical protein
VEEDGWLFSAGENTREEKLPVFFQPGQIYIASVLRLLGVEEGIKVVNQIIAEDSNNQFLCIYKKYQYSSLLLLFITSFDNK